MTNWTHVFFSFFYMVYGNSSWKKMPPKFSDRSDDRFRAALPADAWAVGLLWKTLSIYLKCHSVIAGNTELFPTIFLRGYSIVSKPLVRRQRNVDHFQISSKKFCPAFFVFLKLVFIKQLCWSIQEHLYILILYTRGVTNLHVPWPESPLRSCILPMAVLLNGLLAQMVI